MSKHTSPEQFLGQSPVSAALLEKFSRNLASGALRVVEVNNKPVEHSNSFSNKEGRIAEVLDHKALFGITAENPDFIRSEIETLILPRDQVPESYFILQQRIARNQGHGNVEFDDRTRQLAIDTLQQDQRESLESWSRYLRDESNDNTYPDWFKVYVWTSITRLGDFDKEQNQFKKRGRATTAPFPELNAEALAYVYDNVDRGVNRGESIDDQKMSALLQSANFSKMYSHAMLEVTPASVERRENTDGSWRKFDQIEGSYTPDYTMHNNEATDASVVDNKTAMELATSLRGHGTGWCTAGTRTAAHQLTGGDFYVYYSKDEDGNATVPRIAIRMKNGTVTEVRGIEPHQNLEGNMIDIAQEKLSQLPGGDNYFTKAENMKRLTEIDERFKASGELTPEDIVFLRFSGPIEGFGNNRDPRIDEILQARAVDVDTDIEAVLGSGDIDPTGLANQLIESGRADIVANNLDKFMAAGADIDSTGLANKLIESGEAYVVAYNLDAFMTAGADIDPTGLANQLIESGEAYVVANNLNTFMAAGADIDPTGLANKLIESGRAHVVAYNLDTFMAAGVDPTSLANKLIESGRAYVVANNLNTFMAAGADIDPTSLPNQLIESGRADVVANNLDKFMAVGADIDPTGLANKLIESGQAHVVAYNLDTFMAAGVDPTSLAHKMIESGQAYVVANNLDKFMAAGADESAIREALRLA